MSKESLNLRKREIRPHFSLHRSTELRATAHAIRVWSLIPSHVYYLRADTTETSKYYKKHRL